VRRDWPQDWIDTAVEKLREIWVKYYKPEGDSNSSAPFVVPSQPERKEKRKKEMVRYLNFPFILLDTCNLLSL
jgi:hypothetical protein